MEESVERRDRVGRPRGSCSCELPSSGNGERDVGLLPMPEVGPGESVEGLLLTVERRRLEEHVWEVVVLVSEEDSSSSDDCSAS